MSISRLILGLEKFATIGRRAVRFCEKKTMEKSDSFNVCLDDVKTPALPEDILNYYDLDKVYRFMDDKGYSGKINSANDIEYNYLLRHSISYLLKLKYEYIDGSINGCTNNKPGNSALTTLFDCDFRLVYSPPYGDRKHIHIDDVSVYNLYMSLIDIVNRILQNPDDLNLYSALKKCSNNINHYFLEENMSEDLISEIISHYTNIGAIIMETAGKAEDIESLLKSCRLVHKQKLVNADRSDHDIGFSFSPCGFMIPYHVGVLNLLSELNIVNMTTPLSGASSGSISIVSLSLLNDFPFLMNLIEELSNDALIHGTHHRLDSLITKFFNKYLQENCHEFINSRIGTIVLAYSRLGFCRFKPVLVSKFSNSTDLRDCLRVSSYIPILSSKELVYYNNKPGFDGQLSLSKHLGCAKTAAKRTINTNPYPFYLRTFSKRLLDNEYISPHLMRRDKYLIHYIRFKCLIYHLWLRKIELNSSEDWITEIKLCISLYKELVHGKREESDSWYGLCGLWSNKSLLNLFSIVVKSEVSLDVEKNSAKRIKRNISRMDISKKFTTTKLKFSRTKFNASPITLLDWLESQKQSDNVPSATSDPLVATKISSLYNLLYTITPPMSLKYQYISSSKLLHNNIKLHKLLNISLYSTEKSNLRFFYDLGKTDAFRWIIHDYIAFENWIYLKIKCLEGGNVHNEQPLNASSSSSINQKQTNLVHEMLNLISISTFNLAKSLKTRLNTKEMDFFKIQNNAVKSVILSDCVDSRYTHILGHIHFWVYNSY
ncbi:hypothetical protein BEWA_011520 [Theileria equi strain WA]|uniref:PNPLA domain-containing protein n=1 Tax=Theileria equi strain WA TaxID=1537102 RepID=L0B3Q4_THEEQ|nr:hypothetical protein BEWA_011520 [Theileria equi strain WA]AFZ81734.1 hypothetical protein BEWA_011520 [Theileria equi strain WA]|eukprot:XP_004831400.1 hypothetical protein BEWA_011520 [Theileria equi strain WA]